MAVEDADRTRSIGRLGCDDRDRHEGIWGGDVPTTGPQGRRSTWRQETFNGKVIALEAVNSRGRPIPWRDGTPPIEPGPHIRDISAPKKPPPQGGVRAEYTWKDDQVVGITLRDAWGRVARKASYERHDNRLRTDWTDAVGRGAPMPGFELNVTEQILDGANRTVEVVVDPPQSNLAGLRLAYDEHGRLTSRTAVERTGAPMRNPFNAGVVSTVYEYDIAGRRSAVGWRSFGDVHVIGPLGCATLTFRYDDRGNEAELACLGVDGEPFPLATSAEASQPAIKFSKIQR